MHSRDDLTEEVPRSGLAQPPPSPHVRVEVSVARREHQVDILVANHNLLQKIHENCGYTIHIGLVNNCIFCFKFCCWLLFESCIYLNWVYEGVAIDSVVGSQQSLTGSFSAHNLEKINILNFVGPNLCLKLP